MHVGRSPECVFHTHPGRSRDFSSCLISVVNRASRVLSVVLISTTAVRVESPVAPPSMTSTEKRIAERVTPRPDLCQEIRAAEAEEPFRSNEKARLAVAAMGHVEAA